MKIIIVDDEEPAVKTLIKIINKIKPESEVNGFTSPTKALEFLQRNPADVVFLDIEMYGLNGIELAKKFKDECNNINIIFVTGYSEYALEAVSLRASGYLLKPVSEEKIIEELENLRNPIEKSSNHRIRVQTFGNFEIFVDHEPVTFRRSKSKEILAYLVDKKGTSVTNAELAAVLFEEKEYDRSLQKQMQVYISDMIKVLREVNASDIVIKKYNSLSVNTNVFQCDYYDFLNMDVNAINSYMGEYMINYSWSEFTTGMLEEKNKRYSLLNKIKNKM